VPSQSKEARFKWWKEARFGVFFHWGSYSVAGRGELFRMFERTPFKEYKKLADRFKPKKGWADEWMRFIKRAGARYAVLTAKHCEGYCLFETETTDYSAPRTGPGRDLVAEFVEAARKNNIRFGFYFTPWDWRFSWKSTGPRPGTGKYEKFRATMHTQIEELCTNYGPIDLWWWDGRPPDVKKVIRRMRRWQPDMMINNRCGLKLDCISKEKLFASYPEFKKTWESCMTSNEHWGYFAGDHCWMSVTKAIHWLASAATLNGNLLYNVGPKGDGAIPAPAWKLFSGIGDWLKKYGDSIYGTSDIVNFTGGCSAGGTTKGDTDYLHILHYAYPYYVIIAAPRLKITSATIMKTGKKLKVKQEGRRVILTGLPAKPPDIHDTVIVLKTDRSSEA